MSAKLEDSSNMRDKIVKVLRSNLLIILMIIAVIIGLSLGIGLREIWSPYESRKIFYLRFPGDLLMNMLKMLILPLIVSSLITAMGSLDTNASGRMGLRTVVYYMTTTFSAVILGIILVVTIQPGNKGDKNITKSGKPKDAEPLDALFDLIRNCFPDNLIASAFQKQVTTVGNKTVKLKTGSNVTGTMTTMAMNLTGNMTGENSTDVTSMVVDTLSVTKASGMNILGIVVFSLFLGGVLSKMGEDGAPLVKFFECLHIATMKLVTLVIWYSPVGIIFLIASKLVEMEDLGTMFEQLAYYMVTVLSGLFIHAFIVLPIIYFVFTRKNPFTFMAGMIKAILTAWGTASSSATLPLTMRCLEENNGVDPRVTMFVTPIGATINMDGTALYEAVASIFIAQYIGQTLNVGEVIVVSLTSTAAAIGAAGVPQAGLVTMTIVLTAVGLPIDEITLILSVDWFLDRFRTAVNVLGDAFGAGIVEHLSRNDITDVLESDVPLKEEKNGFQPSKVAVDDCDTRM
ncbi:excitatory amino acid transporter 1-like isoform X2 [Ostrea edulis]|nr:excitatory amino acid transporter 1-like isoform X2 [Ostrea edulis]XP_056019960.1 excitatory amino acid transporter 1-like isoform X2 [Ostrea edulis]